MIFPIISYTEIGEVMKKIVLFICLFLFPINASALTDSGHNSIIMDMDSGRILYQKNSNSKHLIASITKIMTTLVALDNASPKSIYQAKEEVLEMYGTNIYIEYKEKMSLNDLLYGLMLRSGNDAAVVIANNVCKNEKEFVKKMNEKAKSIGMKNTTFANPHGLDEKTKNYSTAYDMAILSSYAYKNYPLYRKISKTYKYISKNKEKTYLWYNRNKLLKSYEFATGGKTGYTPSAGKTFVSTAQKNNLNLTIVTLDDSNTYENHKALYEKIYQNYQNYLIVDSKKFDLDNNYYIKESFSYPLTKEELENIKTLTKIDSSLTGEKKGQVEVYLYNKLIKKIPIYEQKKGASKKSNFFKKLFS